MLKIELLKNVLTIAIASGIVLTVVVQKVKEIVKFKDSTRVGILAFILNMILGTAFALIFSDVKLIYALSVGFFSWVGADVIYNALEDKIFKSLEIIKEEQKEPEIDIMR